MGKLTTIVIALALAAGACKKDEKTDAPAQPGAPAAAEPKAPAAEAKPDPAPGAAAPAAAGAVTIPLKATPAGTKATKESHMETAFDVTPPGQKPVHMVMTQDEKTHVEILEATPEALTKVKVRYELGRESRDMGGQKSTKDSPLTGKTYVVWSEGGTIKATLENGDAPSDAEMTELVDEWKDDLGEPDKMATIVAGRSWTPGEKVTLAPAEVAALAATMDDGMTVDAVTATLVEKTDQHAIFEFEMAVKRQDKGGTLAMPMTMRAKLDLARSAPAEMTMTGTIDGAINGATAKGTIEGKQTTTFQ